MLFIGFGGQGLALPTDICPVFLFHCSTLHGPLLLLPSLSWTVRWACPTQFTSSCYHLVDMHYPLFLYSFVLLSFLSVGFFSMKYVTILSCRSLINQEKLSSQVDVENTPSTSLIWQNLIYKLHSIKIFIVISFRFFLMRLIFNNINGCIRLLVLIILNIFIKI